MRPVDLQLEDLIRAAVAELTGQEWSGPVPVEVSNRPDLGDYASAVAFRVAPALGVAPLEAATRLVGAIAALPGSSEVVESAAAAPPAFVNVRLAGGLLAAVVAEAHARGGAIGDDESGAGEKIVIEHTNVNPNKAAHVGHLRNACLGDTVARLLARRGHPVEVQNYIDDTGVQVADVVVGLRFLPAAPAPEPDEAFDRYCSRVYAAVGAAYEDDPALLERRREVQLALESGRGELAEAAAEVTRRVAAGNLATMARVGVAYDLLTWESDILALGLWEETFGRLRESGAIHLETAGPNAGTWVLPFGAGTTRADAGTMTDDKVLVTSEGIATYTAKDIAYQLWKFGLLGRDFAYRVWSDQDGGRPLWTTTVDPAGRAPPVFGHADRVINVIDMSQSYPQQIVREGLQRLGYARQADRSEHLAYGIVSLTPAAAVELGVTPVDPHRPVAMKGRAGVQVFADDLLDRAEALAIERGADPIAARQVASGAARYYMLKFSNNQDIAFDFDEALKMTGESGVYVQYAFTRTAGILRRVGASGPEDPPPLLHPLDRALVLKMADYPRMLRTAAEQRSASLLAKYAFDLAAAFSSFYDNTEPVVSERDSALAGWRAGLVGAVRLVLGDVMSVLGIPRPERL